MSIGLGMSIIITSRHEPADVALKKYVYRGYGRKFHTNPGGKYVYPRWSKW